MKTLKERFESVVDAYTKAFDKKHEIHDGFWIADIKGYIYGFSIGGYFIDYDGMRFDIDENLDPSIVGLWIDYIYDVEDPEKQLSFKFWVEKFRK